MAEYRVFKRDRQFDEDFGSLTMMQRLLWDELVLLADDQGRMIGNLAWIRSQAFPYDDITLADIDTSLDALAKIGWIIRYTIAKKPIIQIAHWWENQKMQWAQPSKLAAPNGWSDRIRYTHNRKYVVSNWEPETDSAPADGGKPADELPQVGSPGGKSRWKPHLDTPGRSPTLTPQVEAPGGGYKPKHKPKHKPKPKKATATTATINRLNGKNGLSASKSAAAAAAVNQFNRVIAAAGISKTDSAALRAAEITADDLLYALAYCYDPASNVKKPQLIAPRRLLSGERTPATHRNSQALNRFIPDDILVELDICVNGYANNLEPDDDNRQVGRRPTLPATDGGRIWESIYRNITNGEPLTGPLRKNLDAVVDARWDNDKHCLTLICDNAQSTAWLQERLQSTVRNQLSVTAAMVLKTSPQPGAHVAFVLSDELQVTQ